MAPSCLSLDRSFLAAALTLGGGGRVSMVGWFSQAATTQKDQGQTEMISQLCVESRLLWV